MASRTPANIVSLPSLSSSLNTLPYATSLSNVTLHPNMYANRAAESEAKLERALARRALNPNDSQPQPLVYGASVPALGDDSSSRLTMRTKKFTM